MRAYDIALFIVVFNFAAYLTNTVYLFAIQITPSNEILDEYTDKGSMNQTVQDLTPVQDSGMIGGLLGGGWFLFQGFMTGLKIIFQATLGFPLLLLNPPFSLPTTFVVIISALQVFVYGAGLVQFISARSDLGA